VASARQVAANQKNALRSTGPRTAEGKAISSRNALQHGLTAQSMMLAGEDPLEFEALRQNLIREEQPNGEIQLFLVDSIAMLIWRLRRVPAFEVAIIEWRNFQQGLVGDGLGPLFERIYPDAQLRGTGAGSRLLLGRALAAAMAENDPHSKLSRYEAHLRRQLKQLFDLLRQAQTAAPSRD
jgi:hypothetical protein